MLGSGFFISPNDQLRILSGDAMPMRISSKVSGLAIGFAKFVSSFIGYNPLSNSCPLPPAGEERDLAALPPSRSGEGLPPGKKTLTPTLSRTRERELKSLSSQRRRLRVRILDA